MIILGLGSNLGDRLANLRKALTALRQLPQLTIQQVSPVYWSAALLPENAGPDWNQPYLNAAIRLTQTSFTPLELLQQLKKIELAIGRDPQIRHWGPRIIDIDILAWENVVLHSDRLTLPHPHLLDRPFALWPLADVAPSWITPSGETAAQSVLRFGSRFDGAAPFQTQQIPQRIDTPQLMGILNVTPNSFSDGGKFLNPEHALAQFQALANAGADIIDIGAESTAPDSLPCSVEEEWQRLEPVLTALQQPNTYFVPPKISIDTRHVETAQKALAYGITFINDVSGLENPAMRELIAATQCECVFMHQLGVPASRQQRLPENLDPVPIIYDWAARQIEVISHSGIALTKIIFDPGIGFGKTAAHSLALIQQFDQFKSLGVRLLAGHSRKLFLTQFTPHNSADRDIETLITSLYLADHQVDFLRVHNIDFTARALRVNQALHFVSASP